MNPQGRRGRADEVNFDFGEVDPRRRALLLESEAEELRHRLDTLLAELQRHRRSDPAARVRRQALPTAIALVVGVTGVFAFVAWRRRRRLVDRARLGILAKLVGG